MAETDNLNVRVNALVNLASFSAAEKAVGSFTDNVMGMAKMIGGVIAAGSVAMAIQRTADKFNDLGDVVSRVGNTTVEDLDRLGYVADLTGSDAMTATASFENLSQTIGEAAQGIGRGAMVFQKLGLSAKDAQGNVKTTTQVLDEVKEKIKDLSKSEQSAYIQRLGLDKTLIGMLTSDTTEIVDQYNKRTKALGINVDEAAELGAKYNDAIKITKRGLEDVVTAFVLRVLPSITTAIERVSKLIDENAGLIKSYIEPIAAAVSIGADLVTGFITGVGKLFKVLGKWPVYIGAVTIAWKLLNAVFKASPIGRIITLVMGLVTAIGLLIDDYETWKEGGKSFFDWGPAQKWFDHMSQIFDSLKTIVGNFFSAEWWKSKADTISNEMSLLGERIQGFLSDSWNNAITEASNKWNELKDTISQKAQGVYDGIISTFVGLSTWFGDLWKSIGDGAMNALTDIGKAFTQWWNDLLDSVKNFGTKAAEKVENAVGEGWDATKNFFSSLNPFSRDDKEKTVSSLSPSTTNNNQRSSTVYNNNAKVTQTITVASTKEAREIANGTNRIYTQPGGATGGY
jgi:TP901 family phage tail tape measure protein